MAAVRRSNTAEQDLSERQRYWLKHLRAAARKGEPLTAYAERLGLAKSSLYEAKLGSDRRRRLRGSAPEAREPWRLRGTGCIGRRRVRCQRLRG
jgi:hypothetical protein